MKFKALLKKDFSVKFALISFSISFIFFLLGLATVNATSYKLSNYSNELKKLYNFDTNTLLSFEYWFAASNYNYDDFINLDETKVDTLEIIAPNTRTLFYDGHQTNGIAYGYGARKSHSLYSTDILDYKYFANTKTVKITLNDSQPGVYTPELYFSFPSSFKGKIKIHGFNDNINIYDTSQTNIEIIQPTEKK